MAGNDRKPEHGTEAAAHFLAQKWQQPEKEPSVDVRSGELRADTRTVGGGYSEQREGEHDPRVEVRGIYLALNSSLRDEVTASTLLTFYGQKVCVGVVVDSEYLGLETEVGVWSPGNKIQHPSNPEPLVSAESTTLPQDPLLPGTELRGGPQEVKTKSLLLERV